MPIMDKFNARSATELGIMPQCAGKGVGMPWEADGTEEEAPEETEEGILDQTEAAFDKSKV